MSVREFRELNQEELKQRAVDLWSIYNRLSEDVMSGKEKDHSKLKQTKREIARAFTVLNERKK